LERDGFEPLVEFPDTSRKFVLGFEAGRLWEQLKVDEPFEQHIHAENAEVVIRMCEKAGRSYVAEEIGDDWMELRVAP
jgi:hypothetical protein